MTLSSTVTRRWEYTGDASTTVFAYTNKITADGDLDVYADNVLQTITTDYTVSGATVETGGNVTFVSAPAVDVSVIIVSNMPDTQPTDYPVGGSLPTTVVEPDLDRRTIASQQNAEELSRAMLTPIGEAQLDMTLPTVANRLSKALQFDSAGKPTAVEPTDQSGTNVTATGSTTARSLAEWFADVKNARAYGLKGDGSTDDTAAFLALIAGLVAGDVVYFPEGDYQLASGTLAAESVAAARVLVDNITIIGDGRDQTKFTLTGTSECGILFARDINNLSVSGIHFVGNNKATPDSVVGSGLYYELNSAAASAISGFTVEQCRFTNFRGAGWLRVEHGHATLTIKDVRLLFNEFSGGSDRDHTATGTAAHQIYCHTSAAGWIEEVLIVGNRCEADAVKGGISCINKIRRGRCIGNYILNAGQDNTPNHVHAYSLLVYNGCTEWVIANNIIKDGYTTGMYLLDADRYVVTGNLVDGQTEGDDGSLLRAGIAIGGQKSTVAANTVVNCRRGIQIQPNADNPIIVSGNTINSALASSEGIKIRPNATTAYKGLLISGNNIDVVGTGIKWATGGSNWEQVRVLDNYIIANDGMNGESTAIDLTVAGNVFDCVANGFVANGNIIAGSDFGNGAGFVLRNNTFIGDLTGHAFDIQSSGQGVISGNEIRDITTGAGVQLDRCEMLFFGNTFHNVTTPITTTGNFDLGADTPTAFNAANAPEAGGFIQLITVAAPDGIGRYNTGWYWDGSAWNAVWVQKASGTATDSITSGTTQTQAGATALVSQFNRVTTHGNVDDGVKLPSAAAGMRVTILNDTATADLQVWPNTSDAIEAAAADAVGVTKVGAGVAITYHAVDATTWYITDQHTTP